MVTRRIECISDDQRDQLLHKSKNFVHYSVVFDTLRDFPKTEQLAIFIWGLMADFKIYEEYLTLRSIHGATKGIDVFCEL